MLKIAEILIIIILAGIALRYVIGFILLIGSALFAAILGVGYLFAAAADEIWHLLSPRHRRLRRERKQRQRKHKDARRKR